MPLEALAQVRRQPAIHLHRGHIRPRPQQRRRSGCRCPARSPAPAGRAGSSAAATIASSTSPSTRWFWLKRFMAPQAVAAQVPLHLRRAQVDAVELRRAGRAPRAPGEAARAPSGGQPQRGARVEVRTGPHAGQEPPPPGRPDHRGVVRAQPGARHDAAGCPAPPHRLRPEPASAWLAATPPPITMLRAPCRCAARMVLVASTSVTESWKAHASSATTSAGKRRRHPARRSRQAARARPPRRAGPAVLRPLKLKSSVSPCHARGNRRSRRVARAAAAAMAGPPGYGSPSSRPDLVERLRPPRRPPCRPGGRSRGGRG